MELLERAMRECGYNNATRQRVMRGELLYIFCPVDWGYIDTLEAEGADYDLIELDGVKYILAISF